MLLEPKNTYQIRPDISKELGNSAQTGPTLWLLG